MWDTVKRVSELEAEGDLLVQDGNHGEYRPRRREFVEEGTPFIRAADLDEGRILFQTASRINEVAMERIRKGIGEPGDVVLSHKGTVGKVARAPLDSDTFVCSPQTTFWRARPGGQVDPGYLFYYLQSPRFRGQLRGIKGETSMADYVSLTSQRELEVVLPPAEDQIRIAATLGTLDDRIALNRRMNRTLEALAAAEFRRRFVAFEGQGPLVESGTAVGAIPEGWEVKPLESEFDLTMGASPPGRTYNEVGDGLPFYQGVRDFGFRFPSRRVYCTEPKRAANPGDTLVSVRAPVGRVNMAAETCCIGRGVAALRHRSGAVSYTYAFANNLERRFDVFDSEGTVYGSLSKRDFSNLAILVPPPSQVDAFESEVGPLDRQVHQNTEQNATLAALRDELLPELVSGRLRVPAGFGV